MTSRWAYEAIAVNQFKNNDYRKLIFEEEMELNNISFKTFYQLPEIKKYLGYYQNFIQQNKQDDARDIEALLKNSLSDLFSETGNNGDSVTTAFAAIGTEYYNANSTKVLSAYLEQAKAFYKIE